ncbi:MAG: PAS domain-containing protein, partial [Syntrophales bacterium LBB04]|nr:PAS domain-containing protein [Syntrophales bacterium LBB04]
KYTGFDAIGIRLNDGLDFPYFYTNGFSESFVAQEKYLCTRDQAGEIIRDSKGNPYLECLCGNVICGRTNPSLPFFTENGSFWTNNTSAPLSLTTEKDRQSRTRNRCNSAGYESVALIPLRADNEIIGLLQLNDKRTDRFTLEMINFFEGIGFSIGITLQNKRSEELLSKSEQRYKVLLNAISNYVYTVSVKDGKAVETIHGMGCVGLTGYTSEEYKADPFLWINMVHEMDRKLVRKQAAEIISGERLLPLEHRILHKDGSIRWGRNIPVPHYDEQGQLISYDGIIVDITERKQLEEQLQMRQRIDSLGTLAGGIAHDFNNILAGIMGYTEFLKLDSDNLTAAQIDYLSNVLNNCERIAELTKKFQNLSRMSISEKENIDVYYVVNEVVNILKETTDRLIEKKIEMKSEEYYVHANMTELHQVFLNLGTNAIQAI